jgi:hypothetical protein
MLKMQGSNVDDEEITQIISLVEMTKRGIRNQAIPESHEVSIEAERLLAMAYTLSGQKEEAIIHHDSFFSQARLIGHLFDPVALATQDLAYADVLDGDLRRDVQDRAISSLAIALGEDHSWVRVLTCQAHSAVAQQVSKKRKASN